MAAFFAHKPDVALIDLNLPGLSGLELVRRILQRQADARLIVFSMNDDPVIAARAIEAGAKGYIAKNDDPMLFSAAVKSVAAGGVYLHPEMARQIAFLRAGANTNMISTLSPRELEILRLLAAGRTMSQIADALNVSYKTIANNCTHLKQKLGARKPHGPDAHRARGQHLTSVSRRTVLKGSLPDPAHQVPPTYDALENGTSTGRVAFVLLNLDGRWVQP